MPRPRRDHYKLSVRLSDKAAKAVEDLANAQGKPPNAIIEQATRTYLVKHKGGAAGIMIYPVPPEVRATMKKHLYHVTQELGTALAHADGAYGLSTQDIVRSAVHEITGKL